VATVDVRFEEVPMVKS